MEEATAAKLPWYWHAVPHRAKVLYVCEDKELHLVTFVAWLGRFWRKKDTRLVHLNQLMGTFYGFTAAMAHAQPEDSEVTH